ncbi:hypothetical protein [Algoriphagus formosus]|uniref:hypothetical protein n=1 Tax=Algoriphagus formosus TaxID=2007308 RepID=UPI0012FE3E11|nr:hypothetical protein [Algoriphagus formosus]
MTEKNGVFFEINLKGYDWSQNNTGKPTMNLDRNANFISIDETLRNENGIANKKA